MKTLKKTRYPNGRRHIYLFGIKIFSYQKRKKMPVYDKIYAKRFDGLTQNEARFILEQQFKPQSGYPLNLDNPKTFNEKIQWLKLYYHDPLMTKCADKVGVRDYIAEKIGSEYLIPIIGVYDSVDDIDWDKLPNKFVAKVNWGSGQNIICKDKAKLDINDAKQKLRQWMRPESNHYYNFLEWVYKDIEPKIIIEEFLDTKGDDLPDYKFMCYNGRPKNLFVCTERSVKLKTTWFDTNWNKLPFKRLHDASDKEISCPKKFDKMLHIARTLSEPFPFVRVDFFEFGSQLFVGELTFFPGNGTEPFTPVEWDRKIGDLLQLPQARD